MATSHTETSAAPFVPEDRTLPVLAKAVQQCRGCDLYRNATQAVFGELETGEQSAHPHVSVMMIGEQPGDHEDKEGRPFVGPAGKLLDKCLEEAGIDRSRVYVTNSVKHFKWEPRGKKRIHAKPTMGEVKACRPWLETELEIVKPQVIVCLGATAAQSLMGSKLKITVERGKFFETPWALWLTATYHPSAILRMPDEEARHAARMLFVADLIGVAERLRVVGAAR